MKSSREYEPLMVLAFFVNGSFGSASGYSLLRVMTYFTFEFNDACKDLHSLMLKKGNKNMLLYTINVAYFMSMDFC